MIFHSPRAFDSAAVTEAAEAEPSLSSIQPEDSLDDGLAAAVAFDPRPARQLPLGEATCLRAASHRACSALEPE